MANVILLHSGEFTDYEGNNIVVEFYRHYNLNVFPLSLRFGVAGGTLQVSIWSTTGSARLPDPQVGWLNYSQASAEQIPGTNQYKYTYNIICDTNNTGQDREYNWTVNIEDGAGTGIATRRFKVTQRGQEEEN